MLFEKRIELLLSKRWVFFPVVVVVVILLSLSSVTIIPCWEGSVSERNGKKTTWTHKIPWNRWLRRLASYSSIRVVLISRFQLSRKLEFRYKIGSNYTQHFVYSIKRVLKNERRSEKKNDPSFCATLPFHLRLKLEKKQQQLRDLCIVVLPSRWWSTNATTIEDAQNGAMQCTTTKHWSTQ